MWILLKLASQIQYLHLDSVTNVAQRFSDFVAIIFIVFSTIMLYSSLYLLFVACMPVYASKNSKCNKTSTFFMTDGERQLLKNEAKEMFYHAYNAYMDNAFPADELMPLSCTGRYRGSHASRGSIDDSLGNFTLTLIDTLDTLVILGDIPEFENAVKLVIERVTFDSDIDVSVFETNIRVLGGLLSAHVLAADLKKKLAAINLEILQWYDNELLNMAKDLGYRLLPAFNTTTGIPYGKVNLRHGIAHKKSSPKMGPSDETCTACAGTLVLEMATLSRLTGEPIFEEKAHRAMDQLWAYRHRMTDLMGSILNVHSGDWVRREAGIGAGTDSYYEYCLKAYVLLADKRYLNRFNAHYDAINKYVRSGLIYSDVYLNRPNVPSKSFMDALLAFWPGVQVMNGDIKSAIETHEMLNHLTKKFNLLPEAFTMDFQVYWAQHPLRPEFLESTYYLYEATGDHYYLQVGRDMLKTLQQYGRVGCGFATIKDVRTGGHEDSMDSFVLAETFKYLYLLFSNKEDHVINLNDYLFSTEAHLLPLSVSVMTTADPNESSEMNSDVGNDWCAIQTESTNQIRDSVQTAIRKMGIHKDKPFKRIRAHQFQVNNKEHMEQLRMMGITAISSGRDDKIRLIHIRETAASRWDAEEGIIFMRELSEINGQVMMDTPHMGVGFVNSEGYPVVLQAGSSHFGLILLGTSVVVGTAAVPKSLYGCEPEEGDNLRNRIAIVERGSCMFVEKARNMQKAGAIAGIVVDNWINSSSHSSPFFTLSGDGTNDVTIPFVFLFNVEAKKLLAALMLDPTTPIRIGQYEQILEIAQRQKDFQGLSFKWIKGTIKQLVFNSISTTRENRNVFDSPMTQWDGVNVPLLYLQYQRVSEKEQKREILRALAKATLKKQADHSKLNDDLSSLIANLGDAMLEIEAELKAESIEKLKAETKVELKTDSIEELKADSIEELKADSIEEFKADTIEEFKAESESQGFISESKAKSRIEVNSQSSDNDIANSQSSKT